MYLALAPAVGSTEVLTNQYALRRMVRVKRPKNKVQWILTSAWQSYSTSLVRFPLLLSQELRNHSLLPVSVNKVLLEHSRTDSFTDFLAAFVLKLHN